MHSLDHSLFTSPKLSRFPQLEKGVSPSCACACLDGEFSCPSNSLVARSIPGVCPGTTWTNEHQRLRCPWWSPISVVSRPRSYPAPLYHYGARVDSITIQDVQDALWKHRTLVKTWWMRDTLHLLSSHDFPLYIAALKTLTGYRSKSWLKFCRLSLDEIESIIAGVRTALDNSHFTREELVRKVASQQGFRPRIRREMLSGWGSVLHPAAYQGNLCFGPSQGQNVTFVRPDQWLGKMGRAGQRRGLQDTCPTILHHMRSRHSSRLRPLVGSSASGSPETGRGYRRRTGPVEFNGRRSMM